MSGGDDLAAFLAARLDEEEQTVSYAGPARIAWLTFHDDEGRMLYTTVAAGDDHGPWVVDGRELPEPAAARVVYDPARVLREVEAKRAILAEHGGEHVCFENTHDGNTWDWYIGDCRIVEFLALPYSDHPDYRQEWKP